MRLHALPVLCRFRPKVPGSYYQLCCGYSPPMSLRAPVIILATGALLATLASPSSAESTADWLFGRANNYLRQAASAPAPDSARRSLAAADSDARRALEIRTGESYPYHPGVVASLIQCAGIAHARGNELAALNYAVRGERAAIERFRMLAWMPDEPTALAYAATRPTGLDLALSIVVNASYVDPTHKESRSSSIARVWHE